MLRSVLIAILTFFAFAHSAIVQSSSPTAAPPTPLHDSSPSPILVGSELDFFPYAFVNSAGEADGFSVDLIKAVAKAVDLNIKVTPGPWGEIWNSLVEGQIDLLPLVGKLPERANLIEFSQPHTGTSDAFFVREGSKIITTVTEAEGKTIVVMHSDVAHHKLQEFKFKGNIITVPTISEGLKLVASGQHDAFLGPLLMATLAVRDHKITGLVASPPVADYLRIQAFAVKKGDFALLTKLNRGLEMVNDSGEYKQIYDKWLSPENSSNLLLDYSRVALIVFAILIILLFGAALFRRKNQSVD